MKKIHKHTLVLNADFLPLGLISWKRAVVLSIINQENSTKGVEVVEYYSNDHIKGVHGKKYLIPAVVRSVKYIKQRRREVPFSRKNVFIRDGCRCQYCGNTFPPDELTYDHVIPRAKLRRQKHKVSPTRWDNIVTACLKCNRRKNNRTPKEANMQLVRQPQEPNPSGYILGLSPWSKIPNEWKTYLTTLYKDLV